MTQTLTAMFASQAEAEKARQMLVDQLRLDRSAVRLSSSEGMSDTGYDAARPYEEKGFFGGLKDLMVPDEDRHAYAEGLRRGSVLLSVQVEEGQMAQASSILEQAGAIDLDAQEASWKQQGWRGYDAAHAALRSTDETLKIAEERLVIGKRAIEGGSVRVRAYVVERPVEETVTLRDETVRVERHAVDRPATAADLQNFGERTIAMTETDEVAVVDKEVRVVEEIAIRKEAADRVETVRDTVRRTEVDVEDTTHATRGAATAGKANAGTGAAASVDRALGTDMTGTNPAAHAPDGTPGNPPGTAASRAVDNALGTNISGANPSRT